jgi:hypothetical protein
MPAGLGGQDQGGAESMARQLEAGIMPLLGPWHGPILRHRTLSERYHTQIADRYVNPGNSNDH